MSYKIAVASTDGKVVNQHFGRAEQFHIVLVEIDGSYHHAETRRVSPCCNGYEHELDAFEAVAEVLRDVRVIAVSKIGAGASDYMESKGFVVYEAPYSIDIALKGIIAEIEERRDEIGTNI
jgi:predicted Fe-Mo cluster-binding NifX family protein